MAAFAGEPGGQDYRISFDGAAHAVVMASCATGTGGTLDFTMSPPGEKSLRGDGLSCRFEQRGQGGVVRIAVRHRGGVAVVTMAGGGNATTLAVR